MSSWRPSPLAKLVQLLEDLKRELHVLEVQRRLIDDAAVGVKLIAEVLLGIGGVDAGELRHDVDRIGGSNGFVEASRAPGVVLAGGNRLLLGLVVRVRRVLQLRLEVADLCRQVDDDLSCGLKDGGGLVIVVACLFKLRKSVGMLDLRRLEPVARSLTRSLSVL